MNTEATLDAAEFGVYFNAGQCGNSSGPPLVQRDIATAFTQAVIERSREVSVGDLPDPRTKLGAITTETQLRAILAHVPPRQRHRPRTGTLCGRGLL